MTQRVQTNYEGASKFLLMIDISKNSGQYIQIIQTECKEIEIA